MILRYFYIQKYSEIVRELNINFGGKYKFEFEESGKKLHVMIDITYVKNLYKKYSVISDVSAILGKNGSGKTTILRMINLIFNKFYSMYETGYMVAFENKSGTYIIHTNMDIVLDTVDGILIDIIKPQNLDLFGLLNDIGLIYFSGIFDKATPFQGNANLIDISTNYEFERFYKDNHYDHNESILSEYRLDCILQELKFLICLNKEFNTRDFNPLFKTPNEIEISFMEDWEKIEEEKKELEIANNINTLLKITGFITEFFPNDNETKEAFIQENLLYLLIDELYRQIIDEKYNIERALLFLQNKISNKEWNIKDYFDNVLDELFYEERETEIWKPEVNNAIDVEGIYSFDDILQEIEELIDCILSFEFPDWEKAQNYIDSYIVFFECKYPEYTRTISLNLYNASIMLSELQSDLEDTDYDLFSVGLLMDICDELRKAKNNIISVFGEFILGQESIYVNTSDEDEEKEKNIRVEKIPSDYETDKRLKLLKIIKNQFCVMAERNQYNAKEHMLRLRLDNEDILEFIYNFMELESTLVKIDIKRNDISSGHSAYIDMCSRLNIARKSGEIAGRKYIILLIDEGDIYLHPEMQLKFSNNLLKLLEMMFQGKKVQLILTSNSPFIISDIQKSNIKYLEKNNNIGENKFIDNYKENKITAANSKIYNTFASNVNDLLRNAFFVREGLFGEFSIGVINEIIKLLGKNMNETEIEYAENIISIIGEPLIKKKLENMLFCLRQPSNVSREIEYYKRRIEALEKFKEQGN